MECALYGFKKFIDIQTKLKNKSEVIHQIALKRAFCTIALVMKEFNDSTGIFSFAKWGIMIQEHYHGLLRGMAKGVDALNNTLNCISKNNIILDIQNQFQLGFWKKTRFFVGGINFDNDKTDYIEWSCDFTANEIIDQLERLSIYGKGREIDELFILKLISFVDEIGKGSLRISCTQKHCHYGKIW